MYTKIIVMHLVRVAMIELGIANSQQSSIVKVSAACNLYSGAHSTRCMTTYIVDST